MPHACGSTIERGPEAGRKGSRYVLDCVSATADFREQRRGVTCLNCNIASKEDRVATLEVLCLVFEPKSQSSNGFLCVESCRFALLAYRVHQLRARYENELRLASPPFEWGEMERASAWEVDDDEIAF